MTSLAAADFATLAPRREAGDPCRGSLRRRAPAVASYGAVPFGYHPTGSIPGGGRSPRPAGRAPGIEEGHE